MRKFARRTEPVFAISRGRDMDDFEPQAGRGRRKDVIALGAAILAVGAIVTNALFLQAGPHPSPIFSNKPAPARPAKTVAAARQPAASQAASQIASQAAASSVTLPRARPQDSEPAKAEAPGAARKPVDIISDIQKELARRGFYEGATDGIYGPKTDAAIRDFEQAAGLKGGSEPSDNLLRAITRSNVKATATTNATAPRPPDPIAELIAPPATTTASTASANSGNKRVISVQRALSDFGYGQIKPTGILDRETQGAIEHFERGKKMPVTGQISPRLLKELSALSGRPLE